MEEQKPSIKGIFVNSHIQAVRKAKGDDAVKELMQKCARQGSYKNNEDVPVRDEVRIIECALDILSPEPLPPETRTYEAGRLHFRNFSVTALATIIFSIFRTDFKLMVMKSQNIAGHVFRGVRFVSEDLGSNKVKVTMTNNDYPIDHFRGFFSQWMEYAGKSGTVIADEVSPNVYCYTMEWK